jgi:hypothetical protein
MTTTYYTVVINATGLGGANPADGFIDNTKCEQYMAASSPTTPTTKANSITKERANSRFEMLRYKLGIMANVYFTNIVATGADANTAATAFNFTAIVERGDAVLVTEDENTPGTFLNGAAALTRCIARALIATKDDFADYYDPTTVAAPGNVTLAVRMGIRTERVTVGALAGDLATATTKITVTKIASIP